MAIREFKFSLHLLKRSSHPLNITVNKDPNKFNRCTPDEATLVLIIHQIQGVASPDFLHLLDIFFESHLLHDEKSNSI